MHDHIAWEIFIEGSQAIAEPSTQTGSSRHLAAGLNVGNRRIVIDRLGVGRMNDTQFLGNGRSVGKQLTDPEPTVIVFMSSEGILAGRQRKTAFLIGGHPGNALSTSDMIR